MQEKSHTFFMPRLGGDVKSAPFFCDFAVLSVKNGEKIGVLTLLYAPKKVLFLVGKMGKNIPCEGVFIPFLSVFFVRQACFWG